jgi:hypothetical protein
MEVHLKEKQNPIFGIRVKFILRNAYKKWYVFRVQIVNIHSWPGVAGRRRAQLLLVGKAKVKWLVLTHLPWKFFFSAFLDKCSDSVWNWATTISTHSGEVITAFRRYII